MPVPPQNSPPCPPHHRTGDYRFNIKLYLRWYKRSSQKDLIISAIFNAVSLGAYLANALLFPGFDFLLFRQERRKLPQMLVFAIVTGILAASILSFTYVRSYSLPPIGTEYIPSSFTDTIRYFSGVQYGTISVNDESYNLARPIEHARIFARNFLVVGIAFGLIGGVSLWRHDRDLALFLLIILLSSI